MKIIDLSHLLGLTNSVNLFNKAVGFDKHSEMLWVRVLFWP